MHLYMYTNSTIALKQSRKYIWLISIGNAMWPAGFLIPCKDSISWMGVRMLVSPRYQGLPVWLWHLNLKHDNNNCIGKSWFWLDQKSRELVAILLFQALNHPISAKSSDSPWQWREECDNTRSYIWVFNLADAWCSAKGVSECRPFIKAIWRKKGKRYETIWYE